MKTPTFRAKPQHKPALIMGESGRVISYGELEARANQGAHLIRRLGLKTGDVFAVCIENSPEFFFVVCAARRSGLIVVPISTRLTATELAFIVGDSAAKALIVSKDIEANFGDVRELCSGVVLLTTGFRDGFGRAWNEEASCEPSTPIADESVGTEMLYSSGTTGRPKGICYERQGEAGGAADTAIGVLERLGVRTDSIYLSPAPLYHSAPFAWSLATLAIGATVVVMERFDPRRALELIEQHRVDVSQWVPTHFVRMLKLPAEVRANFDVSCLKLAVHAAAPCPPPVKRAMIAWWGPILLEYFGSSEQSLLTIITSEEWLAHPGSVGRCAVGRLHICDDDGKPLPANEVGQIYAEGGAQFSYLNDAVKTAAAHSRQGWTTVGDIGRLDEEGYLYLTDRKSFMIITGGVNVYPQEIEDLLITHPDVADAAVIGAPDEDFGEVVVAVVETADPEKATPEFAAALRAWLRQSLSGVKAPKYVLFRTRLPRLPTGKMAKHVLRREIAETWATARKT